MNEDSVVDVGKFGLMVVDAVVVELWGVEIRKMTKNSELEASPHELGVGDVRCVWK